MDNVFYFVENIRSKGIYLPSEAPEDYYPNSIGFYIEANSFYKNDCFDFKIKINEYYSFVSLKKISKTIFQSTIEDEEFKFRISSFSEILYTGKHTFFKDKTFIRIFPLSFNQLETLYQEKNILFLGSDEIDI